MRLKRKIKNNSVPFVVLLIVHALILSFTFYKKRDKIYRKLLLSNIGFAYLFEYFVLNLFQGYTYKPNILKNRELDNILGAVFSQAIYIPIIGTTITAFRLGWKWKMLFTIYFSLIERLFIHWKIFRKRWWETFYTFFFLLLFFNVSDIWHRLLKGKNPIAQGITSYLSFTSISVNVLFILSIFSMRFKLGLGMVHTWKEHFIIIPCYSLIISAILLITYKIRFKYSQLLRIFFITILDYLLYRFNVFKNKQTVYLLFPIHLFLFFISNRLFNMIYNLDAGDSEKVIDNV